MCLYNLPANQKNSKEDLILICHGIKLAYVKYITYLLIEYKRT